MTSPQLQQVAIQHQRVLTPTGQTIQTLSAAPTAVHAVQQQVQQVTRRTIMIMKEPQQPSTTTTTVFLVQRSAERIKCNVDQNRNKDRFLFFLFFFLWGGVVKLKDLFESQTLLVLYKVRSRVFRETLQKFFVLSRLDDDNRRKYRLVMLYNYVIKCFSVQKIV